MSVGGVNKRAKVALTICLTILSPVLVALALPLILLACIVLPMYELSSSIVDGPKPSDRHIT